MDQITIFSSHAPEETLEEYVFGRLPEPQCAALEEHLLICPGCQQRLRETDDYIRLMKEAMNGWRPAGKISAVRAAVASGTLAIVAAGVMIVALAVAIPHSWRSSSEPQTVALAAFRGGPASLVKARAGSAIDLVIDASDLDDPRNLQIEVVNESGKLVWTGAAGTVSTQGRILARVRSRLRSGVYWVRLFSTARDLVREFGLRLE